MELKTKVEANPSEQFVWIYRDFELPLDLLFKAYTDKDCIEEWMGTTVLKLDNFSQGAWKNETKDANGHVVLTTQGVIHEIVPEQRIIRTFQMMNTPFPVQLEFYEFEAIDDSNSRLKMQVIYKSVEDRDNIMKLPFLQGINMAHTKLEKLFKTSN